MDQMTAVINPQRISTNSTVPLSSTEHFIIFNVIFCGFLAHNFCLCFSSLSPVLSALFQAANGGKQTTIYYGLFTS